MITETPQFEAAEVPAGKRLNFFVNSYFDANTRKSARTPQNLLLKQVEQFPTLVPYLDTCGLIQERLLDQPSSQDILRGLDLLRALEKHMEKVDPKPLELDEENVEKVRKILERDNVAKNNSHSANILRNPSYSRLIYLGQQILRLSEADIPEYIHDPKNQLRGELLKTQVGKIERMTDFASTTEAGYITPTKRNNLINLLKEGLNPWKQRAGERNLFEIEYKNFSLSNLDSAEELNDEDIDKTFEYIASALGDKSFEYREAIHNLFFLPQVYYEGSQRIESENEQLLRNISKVQEAFLFQLLTGLKGSRGRSIAQILDTFSHSESISIPMMLQFWVGSPAALIPEWKYGIPLTNLEGAHSLLRHLHETSDKYPKTEESVSQLSKKARQSITSQAKATIAKLGLGNRFRGAFAHMQRYESAYTSHEWMVYGMKRFMETLAGEAFLKTLDKKTHELDHISRVVWQDMFVQGVHYLPIQKGKEIIEFPEDKENPQNSSVPAQLGIKSISFTAEGEGKTWKDLVTFTFRNGFTLKGYLNENGAFVSVSFPRSVRSEDLKLIMPGLYSLLNNIAVLTYHDLLTQTKSAQEVPVFDRKGVHHGQTVVIGADEDIIVSRGKNLPRHQTDRKLVHDVYGIIGVRPRHVTVHRRHVRYYGDYIEAVSLYNQAIREGQNEATRLWLEEEVGMARNKMDRVSEDKIKTWPGRLTAEFIKDPITGEIINMYTWVADFDVPAPSAEEKASPIRTFHRYYKDKSALAFLDNLKLWFVGLD